VFRAKRAGVGPAHVRNERVRRHRTRAVQEGLVPGRPAPAPSGRAARRRRTSPAPVSVRLAHALRRQAVRRLDQPETLPDARASPRTSRTADTRVRV
jgi:hypothetical protein